MFITVPLTRLSKSPKNVRKVAASADADAELQAAIEAEGLLQNLVVEPSPECEGHYEVVAGGRRLKALQALQQAGKLPDDFAVPCRVAEDNQEAISLVENTARCSMHPADQFEAWGKMVREGVSVSAIATRYGVEEALVRRRLKLGRLAPGILDAFRADKINLERLMALTLSDDHEQQLAIYERIVEEPYSYRPVDIRRIIADERVSSKTRLGRFVGVEAYEESGGTILSDLFAEDGMVYFDDPGLLNKLADEKLALEVNRLLAEGWAWAEAMQETGYGFLNDFDRIYPHPIDVSPEVAEELILLQKRQAELEEMDEDDWTEELESEADALQVRQQALQEIVESHMGHSAEEKARSGCVVSISHDGSLTIATGLIRVEEGATDADDEETSNEASEDKQPDEKSGFTLGKQLSIDLTAHRLQITKSYLATDFDLAFDLAVFSLCYDVFRPHRYNSKPLDISINVTEENSSRDDLEDTAAHGRRETQQNSLDLSWLNEDQDAAFKAFCALPLQEKQLLFAYCIAQGVQGQLAGGKHTNPVIEAVGLRLGIDMAEDWRPTADTFWGRITKAHALSLASETLGAQWALSHSKDKKTVLANRLEQIFSGQAVAGLPASVREAASRWVPDCMAYRPVEIPAEETESEPVMFLDDVIAETEPAPANTEAEEGSQPPVASQQADFLKDHVQIIHVSDTKSPDTEDREGAALNGQPVVEDITDDMLPDFLREMTG